MEIEPAREADTKNNVLHYSACELQKLRPEKYVEKIVSTVVQK